MVYDFLCVYVMSFSRHFHGNVLHTKMAALCLKLCHLKYTNVIKFTAIMKKGGNKIRVRKELRKRKK